jgi:hypothetical protein
METKSCTGSSEVRAGTFPFPGLRMFLAAVGVDFPVSGSSRYFARVRFRFCYSFAKHVAAPANQIADEVLEPARFWGQIPFPPSPRVLG